MISIIAAIDKNGLIGKEGKLPWHLPTDLKNFREVTSGHPIIMGRKTFESIGRVLPNRENIVISSSLIDEDRKDLKVAKTFEEALDYAKDKYKDKEIFVIGGGSVFKQAMNIADRLYITVVEGIFDGDVYFPKIDKKVWKVVRRESHKADERNQYDFEFIIYDRTKNSS